MFLDNIKLEEKCPKCNSHEVKTTEYYISCKTCGLKEEINDSEQIPLSLSWYARELDSAFNAIFFKTKANS